MQKRQLRFIINPIAGTRYKNLRPEAIHNIIDSKKFDVSIVYTERAGHAEELARLAAEQGVDIVAIAGGDGSVNEASRGLKYTSTALAIIPIGSGNGVARKLKIPLRVKKALAFINNGKVKIIDGGEINGEFFLMSPGIGFDAEMLYNFDKFKMRGKRGYLKSLFQTSKTYEPYEINIEVDGQVIQQKVYSMLISNIGQLGYGIEFDKTAKVDDGELELVTLSVFPKWKIPWYIIVAFFLNPAKTKVLTTYKFKQLKGAFSSKQCLQIDGDYKNQTETVESRVLNKVLRVLVP